MTSCVRRGDRRVPRHFLGAAGLLAGMVVLSPWSVGTAGSTFYVATTGSDTSSCSAAENPATPKRTLNDAVTCLSPGSTLYVRSGTYAESLFDVVPSGTSW